MNVANEKPIGLNQTPSVEHKLALDVHNYAKHERAVLKGFRKR